MKFDAILGNAPLVDVPAIARTAETFGFDGIWSQETEHDPFLPLALVNEHTKRLVSGTSIAVAFSRSPMNLAYTAWDLSAQSQGRFILGLGTQVQAHIERRFGMEWPASPVGRLGEMIDAIRSIWDCWQTGQRLNFRGEHYRLGLMTPFFTPPPLGHAAPPIFISGVNKGMARLAGQKADGFFVHPYHTSRSLNEITLPAIKSGLRERDTAKPQFEVSVTAFAACSAAEVGAVRKQIAFYASTPSYDSILRLAGLEQVATELSQLARRGKWDEMPSFISDELLEKVCVIADDAPSLAVKLVKKYDGIADRLAIYRPLLANDEPVFWGSLISTFRALQ